MDNIISHLATQKSLIYKHIDYEARAGKGLQSKLDQLVGICVTGYLVETPVRMIRHHALHQGIQAYGGTEGEER